MADGVSEGWMMDSRTSRRDFLRLLLALGVVGAARPAHAGSPARAPRPHPDPRPGIDASKVTPRANIHDPELARLYDHVREMPQVCDGLACRCSCMEDPAVRSLLSCYEGEQAMAAHCNICQGQAETAYRHFRRGKSLAEIRAAIDADFG